MGPDYKTLFYWVHEREEIRKRKQRGDDYENWTTDAVLATYRFCNVRREDDRVTQWIKQNIRRPFADHEHLWLMLCVARQINWPDTLKTLMAARAWPENEKFHPIRIATVMNRMKHNGEKMYTGAYMIAAPPGKGDDKQAYIAETVIGEQWKRRRFFEAMFANKPTLRGVHQELMEVNGWGPFMAYQAVVDMRFTNLLKNAPDTQRWAAAGPGTLRGLNHLHGRSVDAKLSQELALIEMRAIYKIIQKETGVRMDFSDVPNILCETDKYLRVKLGEGRPRALYVPGRGY